MWMGVTGSTKLCVHEALLKWSHDFYVCSFALVYFFSAEFIFLYVDYIKQEFQTIVICDSPQFLFKERFPTIKIVLAVKIYSISNSNNSTSVGKYPKSCTLPQKNIGYLFKVKFQINNKYLVKTFNGYLQFIQLHCSLDFCQESYPKSKITQLVSLTNKTELTTLECREHGSDASQCDGVEFEPGDTE